MMVDPNYLIDIQRNAAPEAAIAGPFSSGFTPLDLY
jgi:hypothetical protein